MHCSTHTRGEVARSVYYYPKDDATSYHVRYQLVECSACGNYSLLMGDHLGASLDDGDAYDDGISVYPAAPKSMGGNVPRQIRECFAEARVCLVARAYTASAIMCRKTLESLAAARGVRETTLARSLKKLRDKGDIDERLLDWCDALRLAGNDAVHKIDAIPSPVDVRDMNDLVEAIIDYVYVFQARYESFTKRRAEAAIKAKETA